MIGSKKENDATLSAQTLQRSEVAERKRYDAIELIRSEGANKSRRVKTTAIDEYCLSRTMRC